jgi:hypothetical protein
MTSNLPTPPAPDEYDGNPIIDKVVEALTAFGDIDRDQAAALLPFWQHYRELTAREVAAVLRRFPPDVTS